MFDINLLSHRILVLDGGMGSMIQQYHLTEADYRGTQFTHLPGSLEGNGEALNITRPDVIQAIHKQYLEAGADIIETNTLNATTISMADYGMETYVRDINLAAARLAREATDEYTRKNPDKPRFVAGSIGPTNKTASISPDVSNPAFRNITFDELYVAYKEQIDALIDGGVDALLIETSFDTLNVKAALMAAEDVMQAKGKEVALMVSFTLAGKSGRILSGQTLEAALASVSHAKLLSIGLNCSFGAKDMKPFLKELKQNAPFYISAYPNAGLPNSLGKYDETAETMAVQVQEYFDEGLVNIIGGCCGTTPEHIAAIAKMVEKRRKEKGERKKEDDILVLSGLDVLKIGNNSIPSSVLLPPFSFLPFIVIGERCNVAGSRKFLRLIKEKNYEEALTIARKQVEDGAQILDINVDDGLLDGVREMTTFLNLMASEPEIAKAPVMVDSSDWNIIEAGLKCLQGKSIVNSISLKNGEEDFLTKARKIKSYGAAVVAMAFDESGQADTFERKIRICERMYHLLIQKAGFRACDIIFDPNILAIGTGIEAHNNYAADFIRATGWIKQNLPHAKVSGGVSNLSFSFRGNNYLREAIHAVFLYHAIQAGMDMGIVNPSTAVTYKDVPEELRKLIEDLIFNRTPDATEKLMDWSAQHSEEGRNPLQEGIAGQARNDRANNWRTLPVAGRLQYALIKGVGDYLEVDLQEALKIYPQVVDIIDQPLMEGMNEVGRLFGEGKMFLPQVVKTARTMKKAVAILQPHLEASQQENTAKAGKILFATVKGDVHDIGKNIASVVLSCNNYEVIDIGVMVPAEEIIRKAQEYQVDIIGLSGLITPSLQEMATVAAEMQKAGLSIPLLIGGATTSPLHTALKIDPLYQGAVNQVSDASQAVPAVNKLLDPVAQNDYIKELKTKYETMRNRFDPAKTFVSLDYARKHAFQADFIQQFDIQPCMKETVIQSIPVKTVYEYIDWGAFLTTWKFPARYSHIENLDALPENEKQKAAQALHLLEDAKTFLKPWLEQDPEIIRAVTAFYPARKEDDTLIVTNPENEEIRIPLLRQQEKREDDTYKSLADFIRPEGDTVGLFAVTAGNPARSASCGCGGNHDEDTYTEILDQTLRDRLVEAAAVYLQDKVLNSQGIRPASGYPSLPDLSVNFTIDRLLQMNRTGITLTPNGAMNPPSSIAGLYITHPQAKYFYIGKIDEDQLEDYATKTGRSITETKKWLGY